MRAPGAVTMTIRRLPRTELPGSEPAEGQSLLKQHANVFRESDPPALTGPALCGKRGALSAIFAFSRGRQKTVNIAGACHGQADDQPARGAGNRGATHELGGARTELRLYPARGNRHHDQFHMCLHSR
jgi:hypothetical protein